MVTTLFDGDVLVRMAQVGGRQLVQAVWDAVIAAGDYPAVTDAVVRETTQTGNGASSNILLDFFADNQIAGIPTQAEADFLSGANPNAGAVGEASILEVATGNPAQAFDIYSDNWRNLTPEILSSANPNAVRHGSGNALNQAFGAGNIDAPDYASARDAMLTTQGAGLSADQRSIFYADETLGLRASYDPVRGAVDYTPAGGGIPSGNIAINLADRPSVAGGVSIEDAVRSGVDRVQGSVDPIEAGAGRSALAGETALARLGTAFGIAGLSLAVLDGITSAEAAYAQYNAGDVSGAQQTLERFGARLAGAIIGGEIGGEFGGLPGALIGSLVGAYLGNSAIFGADAVEQGLENFANSAYGAVHELLTGALDALADAAGLSLDASSTLLDGAAPYLGEGGADGASRKMGEGNDQISPLVLDIRGDGIDLLRLSGASPYFDLGATGFAHKTGWIGSGSGFLALDRNGNGVIDSGLELFGTAGGASEGFAALRASDNNHDNVIDANDGDFSQLRVWTDLDRDALTDAGELQTLAELGIVSIGLNATAVNQTNAGNTIKLISSYTLSDGTLREIADVYFTNSLTFTDPATPVVLTPDVAALPQLRGYGAMLDLRSAAMADVMLKGQVATLAANVALGPQASLAAIKSIMLEWSHSALIDPSSRGGLTDARELDFLEKYTGIAFYDASYLGDWAGQPGVPRWRSALSLQEGWDAAFDASAARLLLQSGYHLPEFKYVEADDMVLPASTWQASLGDLYARLGDISAANAAEWGVALRVADAFRLDARMTPVAFLASIANATSSSIAAMSSTLIFGQQFDVAANGDITITGATENAILYAGPKVRAITIAPGQSTAPPPLRNTVLFGGGSGSLELNFTDYSGHGLNSLILGGNISAANITTRADRSGSLYLANSLGGYEIKITKALSDVGTYGVQSIDFVASGTSWDSAAIAQLGLKGTAGADVLYGTLGADLFDGGGGGDYAFGRGGNDTFFYNAGYGALEINEADFTSNANNILKLGVGISAAQISVTGDSAGNLFLTDGIAGDQIKIDGLLTGSYNGVQSVQFADGTSWTRAQLVALASQITGSNGNDRLFGTPGADVFDGKGGNDYEQGNGGNDIFLYNAGYGALEIKEADFAANPSNILRLGSGITAAQVRVTGDNAGNMYLTDGIAGDQIKIDNMLSGSTNGVQSVQFADGTTWTRAQIILQETTGTTAADLLYGTPGSDIFDGKGGTDFARGNGGNDIFLYNAGYGALEISEADFASNPNNILRLGSGISAAQVRVTGDGAGNVYLTDGIAGDQVKINGFLSGSYNGVQSVQFADGTSWTRAQLILQETTGTAGADLLYGTPGADVFDGKGGNDRLTGGAGADIFAFSGAFGADTVTDFAALGLAHDFLQFDAAAFSSASAALAAAHQVGADTVINSGANSVTLKGVIAITLTVADFRIQ